MNNDNLILSKILDRLISVDESISDIKSDIKHMDNRLTNVEADIGNMKSDISTIKGDIRRMDKKLDAVFSQTAKLTGANVELTKDVEHLKLIK